MSILYIVIVPCLTAREGFSVSAREISTKIAKIPLFFNILDISCGLRPVHVLEHRDKQKRLIRSNWTILFIANN